MWTGHWLLFLPLRVRDKGPAEVMRKRAGWELWDRSSSGSSNLCAGQRQTRPCYTSTPKAGKQVSENLSYTRDGGVLQSHLPVQRSKEISTLAQHRARAPTQVRIEASLESASLKTDAYFSYSFRQKGFYSSSVLRL